MKSKLLVAGIAALAISGCSKVPSGYVGVKVNLLGSDKGVDVETLKVGRYFLGINEEMYLFPTFTQNYVWTKDATEGSPDNESIDFQTKEGLVVNGDFGISYSVDGDKAALAFQKWRKGVDEITDIYLRNIVRNALVTTSATMSVESIYGEGKVSLMNTVNTMVQQAVAPYGIVVDSVYTIGAFRLPESVQQSIELKIQATQKAQQRENDVATANAQAKIVEAEALGRANSVTIEAKAQADANRILAQSLSPELVNYRAIDKWNGVLPVVSTNSGMMLNLDSLMNDQPNVQQK